MINDQVIWWIVQNPTIYLNHHKSLLNSSFHSSSTTSLSPLFKKVISQLFTLVNKCLNNRKNATVQGIITFCIAKQSQKVQSQTTVRPIYQFEPPIKKIIPAANRTTSTSKPINIETTQAMSKNLASLLLLQTEIVRVAIQIFGLAVRDLVAADKRLQLDLGFCRINLDKSKANCLFKTTFLKGLNSLTTKQSHKDRYLSVYSHKTSLNCQNEQKKRWGKGWEDIKQGNLFNGPCLRQIKDHLENGYRLELKFKRSFKIID